MADEASARDQQHRGAITKAGAFAEDGDDASLPAPKRQRVYVACEYCRLKKQKCDSKRPGCSACVASNQKCVYGAGVKKRGLPPGYVRILETLFGFIFTRVAGGEQTVATLLADSSDAVRQSALGKHEDGAEEALQKFKKSRVLKLIERLLDADGKQLEGSPDEFRTALADQHELLNWQSFVDRELAITSGNAENGNPVITYNTSPLQRTASAQNPALSSTSIGEQINHLPLHVRQVVLIELLSNSPAWLRAVAIQTSSVTLHLPANTWSLLDFYFSFTNCWLPMIQRQDILKTFHSYKGGDVRLDLESQAAEKHAALWAVMAYASFQEQAMGQEGQRLGGNHLNAQLIHETARSLIPPDLVQYGPGHVQALVILSLVNCGCGRILAARELVGQAIRGAGANHGTHDTSRQASRNRADEFQPKDEGIMMSCFIVDMLLSSLLRMPPQLTPADVINIEVIDTDRLEEYEPWCNRTSLQANLRGASAETLNARRGPQYSFTIFTELFKLMSILHEFRWKSDDCKSGSSHECQITMTEMQKWATGLPPSCGLVMPLDEQRKLQVTPQQLNLHLLHSFAALLCLEICAERSDKSSQRTAIDSQVRLRISATASLIFAYSEVFGAAAMPSIYQEVAQYISTHQHAQHSMKSAILPVCSTLRQLWSLVDTVLTSLDSNRSRMAIQPEKESTRHREKGDPQHSRAVIPDFVDDFLSKASRSSQIYESDRFNSERAATLLSEFDSITTPQILPSGETVDFLTVPAEHSNIDEGISESLDGMVSSNHLLYSMFPGKSNSLFPSIQHGAPVVSREMLHGHLDFENAPHMPDEAHERPTELDGRITSGLMDTSPQYGSQGTTTYGKPGPSFDTGPALAGNYDLDALFNELAPMDHGGSQQAFMMNLGISGDLDFDLDTFFT